MFTPHDYSLETLRYISESNSNMNDLILESVAYETDIIIESLQNMVTILEADANDKENGIIRAFKKMMEFLRDIFNKFKQKMKDVVTSNKKWFAEGGANKLDDVDLSDTSINMMPYWNISSEEIRTEMQSVFTYLDGKINDKNFIEKYKTLESIKECDTLKKYLDRDKNLIVGLKNYFRVKSTTLPNSPSKIKGSALKNQALKFKNYCENFDSNVLDKFEPLLDKAENDMERQIKSVEECFMTNMLSELSATINYKSVFEKTEEPKPTDVEVTKGEGTEGKTKSDGDNSDTPPKNEGDSDKVAYLKTVFQVKKIFITTAITILEEKYFLYIKTLRQLVK